jgi:hypothetical protein
MGAVTGDSKRQTLQWRFTSQPRRQVTTYAKGFLDRYAAGLQRSVATWGRRQYRPWQSEVSGIRSVVSRFEDAINGRRERAENSSGERRLFVRRLAQNWPDREMRGPRGEGTDSGRASAIERGYAAALDAFCTSSKRRHSRNTTSATSGGSPGRVARLATWAGVSPARMRLVKSRVPVATASIPITLRQLRIESRNMPGTR